MLINRLFYQSRNVSFRDCYCIRSYHRVTKQTHAYEDRAKCFAWVFSVKGVFFGQAEAYDIFHGRKNQMMMVATTRSATMNALRSDLFIGFPSSCMG